MEETRKPKKFEFCREGVHIELGPVDDDGVYYVAGVPYEEQSGDQREENFRPVIKLVILKEDGGKIRGKYSGTVTLKVGYKYDYEKKIYVFPDIGDPIITEDPERIEDEFLLLGFKGHLKKIYKENSFPDPRIGVGP